MLLIYSDGGAADRAATKGGWGCCCGAAVEHVAKAAGTGAAAGTGTGGAADPTADQIADAAGAVADLQTKIITFNI